jgi:hypothetical protein
LARRAATILEEFRGAGGVTATSKPAEHQLGIGVDGHEGPDISQAELPVLFLRMFFSLA